MMNPYISWALLLVVAGGLGWYYNVPNSKAKTAVKPAVEKIESATGVKKPKKKAKKSPEPTSSTTTKKVEEKPAFEYKATEGDHGDEEIDQKEMAKRFTAVKSGIPAQVSGSEGKSQKKKKKTTSQLEAEENTRSGSRVSTRTSSTAGADADDDLSPAGSPPTASSAGYVSDMLEAPAPGASVLRVTGSMEAPQKKQKAQSFKQVETKKQRQQRAKNEARKQQVQEAEAERRKLLEKQLHMAREAERREAAKSKPVAPQSNAWQAKEVNPTSNGTPNVSQSPSVELLDTFEAPSSKQSPATASSSKKWDQGLPSEEEQMRILGADPIDDWTTVSSKKPKKKGGKADESFSEASASETQVTPAAPVAVPAAPKVTVTPTYIPDILRSKQKGHPLDSDWAA
ncbi:uncharacterized protein NFIA_013770 [Aspergillus fischeri NRRL 181]|uniref:Uncharacterized protein n=1 Tax=Neosartorya fischeri (strain ATCC 1020 / DSM 3700 / CBS 544.65 / FGSC A1164 / JCM 1740 / NRRL 181 / WB 181) TaxID=331117 RepID=A1D2P4_NEOFI|nr:conserved hypothetical protein [Aspergillus fischeri NRRL 181]EAW22687.1 conserved hypothetical protein [Aspergillus fischeri NRRL 181]KAG2012759.1 hypothetical protein GB937_006845 [Aspergillus fischeri]